MKKLTIRAMRRLAKSRGGRCLSDVYVGANSKLTWQCAKGHQWMATPSQIQQGHWCPDCAGIRRLTIDQMHHLAAARGGNCLSDIYVNTESKLLWQCAKGHRWMAKPSRIKRGGWCPYCYGKVRLTIQHMHRLAKSRGGRCLSKIYINAHSKLTWQCSKGHKWEATPSSIKQGHWCPKCRVHHRLTLEDMKETAASRGGLCLSDEYINSSTHLIWQCRQGHQWRTTPNSVRMGTWCPACYLESTGR